MDKPKKSNKKLTFFSSDREGIIVALALVFIFISSLVITETSLCNFTLGKYLQIEDGKITETCNDDIRAYEFGREMYTLASLDGLTLVGVINSVYKSGLGVSPPYEADNDCVQRGFNDAERGIVSPYNNDGKSWKDF